MPEDRPLVLIEWLDSALPVEKWLLLSDCARLDVVQCESVGWLIQDDDVKVLAPNVGGVDSGIPEVCGIIRIPACAVTRVVRLRKYGPFSKA